MKSIGEEIRRIRIEKKITQKQLSEGICTQPTISMIEKGIIMPGIDILVDIAAKLQVTLDYFTEFINNADYEDKKRLILKLEDLALRQKFVDIHNIVKIELQNKIEDRWLEAYLKWLYFLSRYYIKKESLDLVIGNILQLIRNVPSNILNREYLLYRIYNSIAFLHAINKNYSKALFYYRKIDFDSVEETRLPSRQIFELRFLYNQVKTLYDMGEYGEAIRLSELGITKSINYENMSLIGNFYYYLAQTHEKTSKNRELIVYFYKKSLFFFELLNRELYVEILKNKNITSVD
ncbi:helix-turn-helix domain-containing protein [Lysinibacillus mangiferihumi]|uniref:helix-turn-helix domain-containing protein n=1 Tax=Lysinibacillus mangiferihumi TaxID=1130819 RepID=UPI00142D2746|nr:helix-turn-helix domain-containing protein [Lysinibacillus mangiferihumi]